MVFILEGVQINTDGLGRIRLTKEMPMWRGERHPWIPPWHAGNLDSTSEAVPLTQMGCVIYERYGMNILDALPMREIWKVEQQMRQTRGWSDYCFKVPLDGLPTFLQDFVRNLITDMEDVLAPMNEDTHCIAFKPIFTDSPAYMQGTLNMMGPGSDDLTDDMLWDFLILNRTSEWLARLNGKDMGTDFKVDGARRLITGSRMRSMFPFAFPIAGYQNKADCEKKQITKLGLWQQGFSASAKAVQKKRPEKVAAFSGFPFAQDCDIEDLILRQV
jgi:hypothetical protein